MDLSSGEDLHNYELRAILLIGTTALNGTLK